MSKKKKIFLIGGAVIVIVILIVAFSGGEKESKYVTYTVDKGAVVQTVDATGEVASSEAIDLNFKTTGKLTSLNVKVGDTVIAGTTLAALDLGALSSRVDDARGDLEDAQANYEKVLAGATEEDIRISEIGLAKKEQELEAAQTNLDNLIASQETEVNNLRDLLLVKIEGELLVAENALQTIKTTLDDDDASDTLGILNRNSITDANDSLEVAELIVSATKKAIAPVDEHSLDFEIEQASEEVKDALDSVRIALTDTYTVLENTITSSDLTQTELDALVAGIQTEQTNVSTSKTNLETAESNWTNKQVYYQDQVAKQKSAIAAAEDAVDLAQAELNLKKAGPQDYELKSAQAKISRAQAGYKLAVANMQDAVITAPVAGTITDINFDLGEQTSLSGPVIEMIGQSNLEIEVDIPESDIAKIDLGQEAEITLDSFGDDEIFYGAVAFINPAETIIQDVVYYEVKVQFSQDNLKIKPGMTANVIIKTDEVKDVLRVPLRAVKQENGDKYIDAFVSEKEDPERKDVEIGLRGDDFYEIKSGLSEGDEVITFVNNGN